MPRRKKEEKPEEGSGFDDNFDEFDELEEEKPETSEDTDPIEEGESEEEELGEDLFDEDASEAESEEVEAAPEEELPSIEDETPMEDESSKENIAFESSPDVAVQLVAVMGKRKLSLRDILDLKLGSVVDLKRPPNETVDLVANGKLIARGELVEIEGKLGVKILKIVR
ncbi:MAG: FliM/FliN family flagellar motor C-terminal domain-containing protein [Pseudomonadota bacterium]